jgi:hypothetical protein
MFLRLSHVVLWKYADDVSVGTLYRHHRIAETIAYTWMTSSVLMASTMVDFLVSKGWWRQVAFVVLLIAGGVALAISIPGLLSVVWANEIEETLKARGCRIPGDRRVVERMPGMAMRMCFWFGVLVLAAHLFR